MVRPPCREDTSELTKGPWSKHEDEKLIDYIGKHGHGNWRALPKKAGLNRCGKSCRLRWINYLRPNIKRGPFSDEEELLIIKLHSQLGSRWSRIATYLPGRTDNEIKNHWNTRMRKKLIRNGLDPNTHQLLLDPNLLTNLSLLKMITYPNWDNVFYPANKFHLSQNPMTMINQTTIDPTECLLRHAIDYTNQLLLSQSLMQIINPKPFPNQVDSFGRVTDPQLQEFSYDTNNMVNNTRNINTLPSVTNPVASFDCEFQPNIVNLYRNGLNTDYIPETETSLPNLFSVETPNISNQVGSNLSPVYSPRTNIFEDWDKFWNDEAM